VGRKGYTYEYIKEQIEKDGYKLLSTEYITCRQKLKIKCPKGHESNISWRHFEQGTRCIECFHTSLRLTINSIKKQMLIIAPTYRLLSTKYINVDSNLEFMCDKDHKFFMDWYHFNKREQRCPECAGNKKLTIDYIKKQMLIIAPSYKLLSTKYINVDLKLKFMCDEGHIFFMKWDHFQANHRCRKCSYKSGSEHHNWKNYTEKDIEKINNYRAVIVQLTKQNYKKYKKIINPNKLKRGHNKYHVDHIFSVMEGFRNKIPTEIIANPCNLQMLTEKENICKYDSCWQTKKMLYQNYYKFKLEDMKEEK